MAVMPREKEKNSIPFIIQKDNLILNELQPSQLTSFGIECISELELNLFLT